MKASAATSASRSYTEAAENDGTHPRINDVGLMQGGQDAAERKFSGASSSFIFLKWLDAESTDKSRSLLPHLRHSIRTSEAYAFDGVMPSPPTLPKPRWIEFFLQRYFSTIHALFPIVDEDQVRHLAQDPELHGKDPLASILLELVLSHGAEAGEAAPEFSAEAERMFQHAWMAMPAVIASPFETSVQILGLLCLGLHSVCVTITDAKAALTHLSSVIAMALQATSLALLFALPKAWDFTTRGQTRAAALTHASVNRSLEGAGARI